jgi:hypothetical protein
MAEKPSFVRKIDWAEHHLVKLERHVDAFRESHPYTVTRRIEGKDQKTVWRLEFNDVLSEEVPLILGDVLYNMRTSLEHLAAALVRPSHRSHMMFPIFTEPIWEIPWVEGENEERTKRRNQWGTITRFMRPEAVAILKAAQPVEPAPDPRAKHALIILNILSNKDRHRDLSVVAWGLAASGMICELVMPSGVVFRVPAGDGGRKGFPDGAEITPIPPDVVQVNLQGTPRVIVRIAQDWGYIYGFPMICGSSLIGSVTMPSLRCCPISGNAHRGSRGPVMTGRHAGPLPATIPELLQ